LYVLVQNYAVKLSDNVHAETAVEIDIFSQVVIVMPLQTIHEL
jgi:hypothetical protein